MDTTRLRFARLNVIAKYPGTGFSAGEMRVQYSASNRSRNAGLFDVNACGVAAVTAVVGYPQPLPIFTQPL